MKKTVQLFCFLLLLSLPLKAQVSAVMNIEVNVVSGSKVSYSESMSYSLENDSFTGGTLTILSAPNSIVDIQTETDCYLETKSGESIRIVTSTRIEKNIAPGNHLISIGADIQNPKKLDGNYKGSITTVINYL